jgi:hypothetical protein
VPAEKSGEVQTMANAASEADLAPPPVLSEDNESRASGAAEVAGEPQRSEASEQEPTRRAPETAQEPVPVDPTPEQVEDAELEPPALESQDRPRRSRESRARRLSVLAPLTDPGHSANEEATDSDDASAASLQGVEESPVQEGEDWGGSASRARPPQTDASDAAALGAAAPPRDEPILPPSEAVRSAVRAHSTRTLWRYLAVAVALPLLLIGGYVAWEWFDFRGARGLKLQVENMNGQLRIEWDRNSDLIRTAAGATLEIHDGAKQLSLWFRADDLRVGSVTYVPQSPEVRLRLRVQQPSGELQDAEAFYRDPDPGSPKWALRPRPTTPESDAPAPEPEVADTRMATGDTPASAGSTIATPADAPGSQPRSPQDSVAGRQAATAVGSLASPQQPTAVPTPSSLAIREIGGQAVLTQVPSSGPAAVPGAKPVADQRSGPTGTDRAQEPQTGASDPAREGRWVVAGGGSTPSSTAPEVSGARPSSTQTAGTRDASVGSGNADNGGRGSAAKPPASTTANLASALPPPAAAAAEPKSGASSLPSSAQSAPIQPVPQAPGSGAPPAASKGAPVPPGVKPGPSPAALPTAAQYRGPARGRLIWTGQLQRNGVVTVQGRSASTGFVNGELPSVPVRISVRPGNLSSNGMVVYTDDSRHATRTVEPASAQNGWNRTELRFDARRARDVIVTDAPGPHNNWAGLTLRSSGGTHSVIVIDWEVVR